MIMMVFEEVERTNPSFAGYLIWNQLRPADSKTAFFDLKAPTKKKEVNTMYHCRWSKEPQSNKPPVCQLYLQTISVLCARSTTGTSIPNFLNADVGTKRQGIEGGKERKQRRKTRGIERYVARRRKKSFIVTGHDDQGRQASNQPVYTRLYTRLAITKDAPAKTNSPTVTASTRQ